jgi:hypothetical protein
MKKNLEIGICCSPKDALPLRECAYDFLEVNVQSFLAPEKEEGEFQRNMAEAGEVAKRKIVSCQGT